MSCNIKKFFLDILNSDAKLKFAFCVRIREAHCDTSEHANPLFSHLVLEERMWDILLIGTYCTLLPYYRATVHFEICRRDLRISIRFSRAALAERKWGDSTDGILLNSFFSFYVKRLNPWTRDIRHDEDILANCFLAVLSHEVRTLSRVNIRNEQVWRYLNYSYRITPRNLCAVHLSGGYCALPTRIFFSRTLRFPRLGDCRIHGSYVANKITHEGSLRVYIALQ